MKRDDAWLEIEDSKTGPDKLMQHFLLICLPPVHFHSQWSKKKKKQNINASQIKN